jgi:hypothetical protein
METETIPQTRLQDLLQSRKFRLFTKWFMVPALLYATIFFITQPQYLTGFSKGFFLDNGDGLQNVWNIWWVNDAIVHKGLNPYFTTMLHWPGGVSLLPQTMNIINGLMVIPLMNVLHFNLIESVNFAVVFSFVFSGVTMAWFIQKLYSNYTVSLIAGALFTFSSYHFAHAQGHLQLVSMEFIPLFLLAFWTFIEKMRYRFAILAAGALFLVLLCDYYYLFWCIILAGLWVGWNIWQKELKITKQHLKVFAAFVFVCLVMLGPLVFGLLRLNKHDPLLGFHDPVAFSLDPLTIIIPGGSWKWASLTHWHWSKLAYLAEVSVFFGYGLLVVLALAFYKTVIAPFILKKKSYVPATVGFWWIAVVVFGVLALGPRFTSFGRTLNRLPLPYAFIEKIFPTLKISGMPVRWVFMVLIAAIVIVAYMLSKLDLNKRQGRVLLVLFIIVSAIDLWPMRLPLTSPAYRPYVEFLKDQPFGGIIDNGALSGSEQLYNQTLHHKPIAFGYVTRVPRSVDEKDFHIFAALEQYRYDDLCRIYKIRYITIPVSRPLKTTEYPIIYNDGNTLIYNMKNSLNC